MTAIAHAVPADLGRLAAVPRMPAAPRPIRAAPRPITATPRPITATPPSAYVRRRFAVLFAVALGGAVMFLALHGVLGWFGGGPLTASERPEAAGRIYVVQPGDTFWGIASRLRPGEDPRPLVAQLVAAHGSPVLVAGERLQLPGRT